MLISSGTQEGEKNPKPTPQKTQTKTEQENNFRKISRSHL